jgi:DNA-binding response OmpR family regulator
MTEKSHILIVDDEEAIRYFLSEELSLAGYAALTAASGEEALVHLQQGNIDVVVLDLMMEGIDGLQVMKEIERQPLPAEVIILTAHASFDSAVDALRLGGCDYLRKPCRTEELLVSVARALAKRNQALQKQAMLQLIEETARQLQPTSICPDPEVAQPRFLEGRGLLLDRVEKVVTRGGEPLSLTPSEFRLLLHLMENPNRPVGYDKLASALHGRQSGEWDSREARKALSTHLWRLQRKLGRAPDGERYVVNVRGEGYRFSKNNEL